VGLKSFSFLGPKQGPVLTVDILRYHKPIMLAGGLGR